MKVAELIKHFAASETTPVEIDSIIDHLRQHGVDDEIYYFPSDIWEYPANPDGKINRCVDIYFDKSLPIEWQRVVCCKEIVHILDPESKRIATPADVAHLIDRIALPIDPIIDGESVINDKFAVWQAIAIMFPMSCRELLKPALDENKLTYNDIAKITCLPLRYVITVMSDVWEKIYPVILTM